MLDAGSLAQYTGTEQYHRWSILFRNMVLTDGAMYVAKNGGSHGAFWLMDAIASHQPAARKHQALCEIQFWKLRVNADRSCTLECRADSDKPVLIKQDIEYTDFDRDEIELWVQPGGEGYWVIMLPSEY